MTALNSYTDAKLQELRTQAVQQQRHKDFAPGYHQFKDILERAGAYPDRYRDVNNILVCIYHIMAEKGAAAGLLETFQHYTREYIKQAQTSDTTSWANNILETLLEYIIDIGLIQFTENQAAFDVQRQNLSGWLDAQVIPFIRALTIPHKRSEGFFYQIILRTLYRERANFERSGHSYQNVANAMTLGHFFLKLTTDADHVSASRSHVYQLFSELIFNDPEQTSQEYAFLMREAVAYLEKSLHEFPGNQFARKRREQLIDSLTIQEQLHRFDHDVNSKISALNSLIRRIKRKVPDIQESDDMLRIIDDMQAILSLARTESHIPAPEQVDMADFLEQMRNDNAPDIQIETRGAHRIWSSHRGYLNVIFENLIKNSREAYARNHITPRPEPAILIRADFDAGSIAIQDWAGGIKADFLRDNRLLEPYISEKGIAQNMGLGLTLVKKACRILDLEIRFHNDNGSAVATIQPKGRL